MQARCRLRGGAWWQVTSKQLLLPSAIIGASRNGHLMTASRGSHVHSDSSPRRAKRLRQVSFNPAGARVMMGEMPLGRVSPNHGLGPIILAPHTRTGSDTSEDDVDAITTTEYETAKSHHVSPFKNYHLCRASWKHSHVDDLFRTGRSRGRIE